MTRRPQPHEEKVVATNQPIELQCKDCQQPFTFTVGEQKFYETKGFTPPIRCSDCRQKRKQEKESRRPRY